MTDLSTQLDIEILVDKFYKKVMADDLISHFFKEAIAFNWEVHIPVMYNFWETILLGKANYKGNPMLKHIELHQKSPLKEAHFKRWLFLWQQTIEANFEGPKAEEAISKAQQIGGLMQLKINDASS